MSFMEIQTTDLVRMLSDGKISEAHTVIDELTERVDDGEISEQETGLVLAKLVGFWEAHQQNDKDKQIEEAVLNYFISVVIYARPVDGEKLFERMMAKPKTVFAEYYQEISDNLEFNDSL
jgi:hypothetical protein